MPPDYTSRQHFGFSTHPPSLIPPSRPSYPLASYPCIGHLYFPWQTQPITSSKSPSPPPLPQLLPILSHDSTPVRLSYQQYLFGFSFFPHHLHRPHTPIELMEREELNKRKESHCIPPENQNLNSLSVQGFAGKSTDLGNSKCAACHLPLGLSSVSTE